MNLFRKPLFYLLIIGLITSFLRFYKVSEIPVSLYWDEVASTYNGYSIATTGRDEYGKTLPLMFQSFNDYKTPANIYLTGIATKFFGVNEFSARFTSAFFGSLSILVSFFLFRNLLYKQKFNKVKLSTDVVALTASFLFAISPWHIQFSRTGFEANVGLFFVLLAIYLFLKFISSELHRYYFLSMFIFAASIYFYRSIFVFTPVIILVLFFINRNTLKTKLKKSLTGIIIFFVALGPFLPSALSQEGFTRQRQVNVFTNSSEKFQEAAVSQVDAGNTLIAKTYYNRRFVHLRNIVSNYLAHFSPQFLFLQGDGNPRHRVEGMGLMYAWELPFLVVGVLALFKLRKDIRNVILAWILVAPIPAALSVPSPHALRSLNILPMPALLTALGIFIVFYYTRKNLRLAFVFLLSALILISFIFYLHLYFRVSSISSSQYWADGYKQLTTYIFANEKKYDKILISGHWWQPYIYFLFYKNYDPALYQKNGSKMGFDKYIFGGTSWDMEGKELGDRNLKKIAGTKNVLVALSPIEYSLQKENLKLLKEIKNHDDEVIFVIGEIQ